MEQISQIIITSRGFGDSLLSPFSIYFPKENGKGLLFLVFPSLKADKDY